MASHLCNKPICPQTSRKTEKTTCTGISSFLNDSTDFKVLSPPLQNLRVQMRCGSGAHWEFPLCWSIVHGRRSLHGSVGGGISFSIDLLHALAKQSPWCLRNHIQPGTSNSVQGAVSHLQNPSWARILTCEGLPLLLCAMRTSLIGAGLLHPADWQDQHPLASSASSSCRTM